MSISPIGPVNYYEPCLRSEVCLFARGVKRKRHSMFYVRVAQHSFVETNRDLSIRTVFHRKVHTAAVY